MTGHQDISNLQGQTNIKERSPRESRAPTTRGFRLGTLVYRVVSADNFDTTAHMKGYPRPTRLHIRSQPASWNSREGRVSDQTSAVIDEGSHDRVGCHRWRSAVLEAVASWASSPYCRPARMRRPPPSSSLDCPERASRLVRGPRRTPGPIRTCRAAERGSDRHDRRGRDRGDPAVSRSVVRRHGELVRRARRPVRRGDRSSHEPLAVLPGSDERRPSPDLPVRAQVRLLRDHRGREALRLGGPVHQPPRGESFRTERQPVRRLLRPRQLRLGVSQTGRAAPRR